MQQVKTILQSPDNKTFQVNLENPRGKHDYANVSYLFYNLYLFRKEKDNSDKEKQKTRKLKKK